MLDYYDQFFSELNELASKIIKNYPLKNIPGPFGDTLAIVEQFRIFINDYVEKTAQHINVWVLRLEKDNWPQDRVESIKAKLLEIGRERVAYYSDLYLTKSILEINKK